MVRDLFIEDLKKVLKKHNVWLAGVIKIRNLDEYALKTASCDILDVHEFPPYRDTSGPFLSININKKLEESQSITTKINMQIMDKDKLLANGVLSPLDMRTSFSNRREWGEHLKANGCVEIGNDFNNSTEKKREIKGDFNCREELGKVTHQVLEKYGH